MRSWCVEGTPRGRYFALGLPAIAVFVCFGAASAVTIDWVVVGDPGNAADTTGYGAVADAYQIGKFEVTNAQYAEFLNAVAATDTHSLWDSFNCPNFGDLCPIAQSGSSGSFLYDVDSGFENRAVNFVSYFDMLRFANWLHNGQPLGAQDATTTEDGAYTMTDFTIRRNAGAAVFLPSEDEWYKAAYYDSGTGSYFPYPTASIPATVCAAPSATPNTANCLQQAGGVSDVGAYTGSASPAGTFDQGGNVEELMDTLVTGFPIKRGGDWVDSSAFSFQASRRTTEDKNRSQSTLGFRVAAVLAPGAPAREFFTIDSVQSFVQVESTSVLTLEFLGAVMAVDLPLESQVGAGGIPALSNGLRTGLTGHLLVDIPVGGTPALEIINRRSSVRFLDSGSWLPGPPGDEASPAPGALAANVESTAYALSISGVVRGAEFSLGHAEGSEFLSDLGGGLFSFPLEFTSTSLPVDPVAGVFDVAAVVGVLELGDRVSLRLSLADASLSAGVQGTLLEQPAGGRQITLPLAVSIVLTDDSFAAALPISLTLDLTGQIVATNTLFVPEPGAPLACLAALGALALLHRMRRS